MVAYALEGPRWGSGALGTSGGTVTWAIDTSVPASFLADLTAAFADWSRYANIRFQQLSSTANANIVLKQAALDGPNNTLGYATYSYSGATFIAASITFDSGEGWTNSGSGIVSKSGTDFFVVALHEIGHTIGLDHYNGVPAVMNAVVNASVSDLAASDISGVQALYGAATVVTAPPAPPVSSLSPAPAKGAPLVVDAFYFGHNGDVAKAGMDATAHYNQYGWHEGRDPDAYFSTIGYLAANADVARAGVNPIDHYDASGWKEGRDPSIAFDNELYLARNPDVKAAGMDPLKHFLAYGQAEGRQAYGAVGKAGDIGAAKGFDAEFYLLSNLDVAKAALASGGDSFAFALQHYQTFGWHEGRNPNSAFDTKGYLSAYGDVAAAGIEPLKHYDLYGWKEGRDPSASFDTKAYDSHYGDVAAARIDPMIHYLQYGGVEGRSGYGDGHFG